MNKSEIEELIEEYYLNKEKLKKYEDLVAYRKDKILDLMNDLDSDVIKSSKYTVQRKQFVTERLNKVDCPKDIWDEYAMRYESECLYIKPNEKKETEKRYRKERRSRKSRVRDN